MSGEQTSSDSRRRVCTGVIMAAAAVAAIGYVPTQALAGAFLFVVALAALEWGKLVEKNAMCWAYPIVCLFVCAALIRYRSATFVLVPVAIWWGGMLFLTTCFTRSLCRRKWFARVLRAHIVIALPACWFAIYQLHAQSWIWLLYLITLVAGCDIAAYYSGRRFGRTPLCPELSQGKTRAGVVGALGAMIALAGAMAWLLHSGLIGSMNFAGYLIGLPDIINFIMLSVLTGLSSIIGDLTASMAKRLAGVKNSGNLLPGHGGIVDRIDSSIAAAPIFLLGFAALIGWNTNP